MDDFISFGKNLLILFLAQKLLIKVDMREFEITFLVVLQIFIKATEYDHTTECYI